MIKTISKTRIIKIIIINKKYNFKIQRVIYMLWINSKKVTIN